MLSIDQIALANFKVNFWKFYYFLLKLDNIIFFKSYLRVECFELFTVN